MSDASQGSGTGAIGSAVPPLDAARLRSGLGGAGGPGWHVEVLDQVDSTNSYVHQHAARLGPRAVVAAEYQSAGRGRLGRQWSAPPRKSLTFSILLPWPSISQIGWLPLAAGAAVVAAVGELTGLRAGLKWPNDVVVDSGPQAEPGWGRRRKLAGILCEALPTAAGRTPPGLIVGIGLNTHARREELPVPWATSLLCEQAGPVDRCEMLLHIVRQLTIRYDGLSHGKIGAIHNECRQLSVGLGEQLSAQCANGEVITGTAIGVDDCARLMVRDDTGTTRLVEAGDVSYSGE